MVHRCCIPSCGMNVRVPEARGLSYHTFPLKEPQRHKWIAAIIPYMDRPKFKVVQGYTRICSRHFTRKDYSLDSKKRARLSSNAVPSVFPDKGTGTPFVIENTSSTFTDLSSTDEVEIDLPTKILRCASDQEVNASSEAEISVECTETIEQETDPLEEDRPEFVEPKDQPRRRKIKKNRTSKRKSTSPARDFRRKISSNSNNSFDELNIEHVGEAFADIKLSKLFPMGPPAATEPRFATPKDWKLERTENAFRNQQQLLGSSAGSVDSLCSSTDDNNSATPISSSLPLASDSFGNMENNVEPDLLLSIQAVNLNSLKGERCGTRNKSDPCTSSESESDRFPRNQDFEESLLETLTLNDFSLLDGLDPLTDDKLDKLPFDMSSALLNTTNFNGSFLDDHYSVFDNPLQSTFDFDFTCEDNLISEFQNMSAKSDELTPVKKAKPGFQDIDSLNSGTLVVLPGTESNETQIVSKSDCSDGRCSPEGNETKRRKTVRSSFSIERFLQSETDIEYYTGFNSYSKFEAFFNQIQESSTTGKTASETEVAVSISETASSSNVSSPGIFDGTSPSHGALSHIDELFLTLIRLRRKLPEKILGHMFCVTRPAVTRTVRAWTTLLNKILEKSNGQRKENENENTTTSDGDICKENIIEVPPNVQQLLESGLAKSILTNTRPVGVSRKTTSTTACHSTSKSKRPKKEKTSSQSSAGPTSPNENSDSQISSINIKTAPAEEETNSTIAQVQEESVTEEISTKSTSEVAQETQDPILEKEEAKEVSEIQNLKLEKE